MILFSFSEWLPLDDLVRILIVVIAVAIVAPSAASVAIVGLDRRESGATSVGNGLIAAGAGVLFLLVAIGLYALVDR